MLVKPFMYSPAAPPSEQARGAGEEAEAVGDRRDLLRDGRGQRLADVLGLDASELLAVQRDDLGELEQAFAPLSWRGFVPDVVERVAGGGHGDIDVLFGSFRHLRDHLARGRIDDLLVLVPRARPPFASDVHLTALQCRAHLSLLAGTAATSANAEPRMSSPSISCSSGMVSGIRVRITLWCMPERSKSSPRSRARVRMRAVSVSAGVFVLRSRTSSIPALRARCACAPR